MRGATANVEYPLGVSSRQAVNWSEPVARAKASSENHVLYVEAVELSLKARSARVHD